MYFIVLGLVAAAAAAVVVFASTHTVAMFDPKGTIGLEERNLMIVAALLMLVVVIPVFVMTFVFAWRYRADNEKAEYTPTWDHDIRYELAWWAFPIAIIIVLAVITWQSSHALSPYRPIAGSVPPVPVDVVALDWKWLFIYPQQGIATVNMLKLPVDTPIAFHITADAPMNSFWIPSLGGQIYAMPGMSTQLHLMASATGTYEGLSANLSGNGFASMHFPAEVVSRAAFAAWAQGVRNATGTYGALTLPAYEALSTPSARYPETLYASIDPSLYGWIVMKYMSPNASTTTTTIPMSTMAIPRAL